MFLIRILPAFALLGAMCWASHAVAQPNERDKQITEIEKQLADLKKQLDDLKKVEPLKSLIVADIPKWRSIRGTALTNDGKWFAFRVGAQEGEGEVTVRETQTDKEYKFPAGEGFGTLSFSYDAKWFAFTVSPRGPRGAAAPVVGPTPPPGANKSKVVLVNLASGAKSEFEGILSFTFSGEAATHIAMRKAPAEGQTAAAGSDLLLHELSTGTELNLGNVAQFAFDKKGKLLAMLIDSAGQIGNGVHIREMQTGVLSALDTAKAAYSGLSWTKEGDGLICTKEIEIKPGEKANLVLGFLPKDGKWEKIAFDPRNDASFPKNMTLNKGSATFAEDLSGFLFTIQDSPKPAEAKKDADPAKKSEAKKDEAKKDEPKKDPVPKAPAIGEKPELVIWHWKDDRLQSQQEKESSVDKNPTFLATYRIKEKKFIRLGDDKIRRVAPAPKQRWAVGTDTKAYDLMTSLDGKRFQDIHVIDMHSGERKLALSKNRWYFGPSPTGTHFLYYEDGHFWTYDMATGAKANITASSSVAFVDTEDDHPVHKPPTRMMGWSADGQSVYLSDNWDIWQIRINGGPATNITKNGKSDGIRYQSILNLDPDAKGHDFSKPVYVSMYGEWTKKAGYSRIDPGATAPKLLVFGDAIFGPLLKSRNAEMFVYTMETCTSYADYYASGPDLGNSKQLTNVTSQEPKIALCGGTRLIDYTSTFGDRLQGTLYLPANYDPAKKYPTMVYIYEKLSQNRNRYLMPALNGFSVPLYTSNGYAVLQPDIRYQINDPGKSAVGCILPALDAAIKTGVVDAAHVGLQGHSWGGYQTAYLITQTDAFKAACAGAPLTNLISMYSSIYWNIGIANQPIFESSQGRFTSGYWDNLDAFMRNSPVFHAKNVKTPLMLLHNDKDGAVDWNQGIEYFNTLRRLQKPVVMLQYKGENHGVVKPANRKDYTIRMKEFFDHYLMDKPAPTWLKEGIPHGKLDEHLKERKE